MGTISGHVGPCRNSVLAYGDSVGGMEDNVVGMALQYVGTV